MINNYSCYEYYYDSPLGTMQLLSDGKKLTRLGFSDKGSECKSKAIGIFEDTVKWLDCYFAGKRPDFTPDVFASSTQFRNDVWDILMRIPYGQTVTYGDIAKEIVHKRGGRMSAQAVGGAVGSNPIAIIIPCHRVVGANHRLTGYYYGLDVKRRLLEIEGINVKDYI